MTGRSTDLTRNFEGGRTLSMARALITAIATIVGVITTVVMEVAIASMREGIAPIVLSTIVRSWLVP